MLKGSNGWIQNLRNITIKSVTRNSIDVYILPLAVLKHIVLSVAQYLSARPIRVGSNSCLHTDLFIPKLRTRQSSFMPV